MTRKTPARTALSLSALALLVTGTALHAGPLTPPVGPVAPTAKPLAEVEPRIAINLANTPGDANSLFRITQPGSYYLTGDITGVTGKSGIEIASSRVTIDLNGFSLVGVTGSLEGIVAVGTNRTGLAIRNGVVSSWGSDGVLLNNNIFSSILIEDLRVIGNGRDGILAQNAVIRNCSVTSNAGDGVSGGVITGCFARGNDGTGFQVGVGGTISDSTALDNGSRGISVSAGGAVINCVARGNTSTGIIAFGNGLIKNSSSTDNAGGGINGQTGSTIIDCVASDNTGDGIFVFSNSHVRGNTASNNTSDGISSSSGSGSRFEGNTLNSNGRGINIAGSGNIIVRNSARGNTTVNWLIAANNVVGPIVNRTAPGSSAISGDSAPDSTGTSNPNANFTY
jgi:parallel beta-helix repeat protein